MTWPQNMKTRITDETYYSSLQSALNSYDAKLWQIPGLFLTVAAILAANIGFTMQFPEISFRNGLISLLAADAFLILILLHNKGHIFHISIQKKINEFDLQASDNGGGDGKVPKRIPINSMDPKTLTRRLNELEMTSLNGDEVTGARFSATQKALAQVFVSGIVRWSMMVIFVATSVFSIVCLLVPLFQYLLY